MFVRARRRVAARLRSLLPPCLNLLLLSRLLLLQCLVLGMMRLLLVLLLLMVLLEALLARQAGLFASRNRLGLRFAVVQWVLRLEWGRSNL